MSYNTLVLDNYVMKVSSNGQVSIPAPARARWKADRVVVVDFGDRVVLRPLPDDPVGALVGRYRDRGPTTDEIRRQARDDDAAHERRRGG
jgi:bifunctional DNA-binding transcriptional regulator/antitoxin component of YhaV-PrlF toxin-antitoxin module